MGEKKKCGQAGFDPGHRPFIARCVNGYDRYTKAAAVLGMADTLI